MAFDSHPSAADSANRFHDVLGICDPYVAGVFDLSARGGPDRTVVVKARSAAHVRKLATRLGDRLDSEPEGDAPDGSEPWVVVDAGDVVAHVLTEASLARYGLVDLFSDRSADPVDVFAVVAAERLRELRPAG